MMPWKLIVAPTDFSEPARSALRLAANLARACNARLVVLHASEMPPGVDSNTFITPGGSVVAVPAIDHVRATAQSLLAREVEALRAEGVEVETEFAIVSASAAILDTAKRLGADLLVVGTHGRKGLSRLLLGSVAERIVRTAPIPVLTVRYTGDDEAHPTAGEAQLDAERGG